MQIFSIESRKSITITGKGGGTKRYIINPTLFNVTITITDFHTNNTLNEGLGQVDDVLDFSLFSSSSSSSASSSSDFTFTYTTSPYLTITVLPHLIRIVLLSHSSYDLSSNNILLPTMSSSSSSASSSSSFLQNLHFLSSQEVIACSVLLIGFFIFIRLGCNYWTSRDKQKKEKKVVALLAAQVKPNIDADWIPHTSDERVNNKLDDDDDHSEMDLSDESISHMFTGSEESEEDNEGEEILANSLIHSLLMNNAHTNTNTDLLDDNHFVDEESGFDDIFDLDDYFGSAEDFDYHNNLASVREEEEEGDDEQHTF